MKNKRFPVITLLGSNSGNNLGDAAILASTLDQLSAAIPDAEFVVPTTNPSFVRDNYGRKYNVQAIDIMPWTGSIRMLGIPTFRALAKSDIALICDGIIFGKNLFNPLFNFLITLIFVAPWCKLVRCKLVCYCCGIGPFPNRLSRWCARFLLARCDYLTFRDEDSANLARELGYQGKISIVGDVAFVNLVSSEERGKELLRQGGVNFDRPVLGINVTKYVDSWLSKNERPEDSAEIFKALAEGLIDFRKNIDCDLAVFPTHPMDNEICARFAKAISGHLIPSTSVLSHDTQAAMRECDLFIGMRFHSLVLASGAGASILGLVYAPKVRSLMKQFGTGATLELADCGQGNFLNVMDKAWQQRHQIKEQQVKKIKVFKEGVEMATEIVRSLILNKDYSPYPRASEARIST